MDLKATPLGGDVFEFTFRDAGTVVERDMNGNVVLRDTGAIRMRVAFDTLGDSTPGGETLDETVLRVSGPHPGFEQGEAAFCATVHELIGRRQLVHESAGSHGRPGGLGHPKERNE